LPYGVGLKSIQSQLQGLQTFQVMLKMKSRHVAGTITKKKKSKHRAAIRLELCFAGTEAAINNSS